MSASPAARVALPLLLCAVLTACGTTVPTGAASRQSDGSTGGLSSIDQTTGAVDGSTATTGGSGSSTSGSTTGTGGSTSGTGGPMGSTTGTDPSTSGSTVIGGSTTGSVPNASKAPGVSAKEIKLGFIKVANGEALNKAFGAGALTQGDGPANNAAIIKDINSHGGIAGRKITAVYADFDSTSTDTIEAQWARVCEKFTRDTPVYAVIGAGGTDSFKTCMKKAGTAIINSDLPQVGAATFQKYPGFVELGYPNLDRLASYLVTSLQEQKYFTPWNTVSNQPAAAGAVKVGVLTYDDLVFTHAVDKVLVPALRRIGYDPIVRKVSQVQSAGGYGNQAAAVKSAQLAFASGRVTHVLTFEANAGLSLFFLPTAKSQNYFPRYGINSANGFQALIDTGATTGSQVHGAVGFGWLPALDQPASLNPDNGPYSNAERKRCLATYKANGIVFDSGNAQSIGLSTCANLYLLRAALAKAPAVTLAAFIQGVGALGTTYQPAGSLGIDLRPDRHDPSNIAYHLSYFSDCSCFHYSGTKHIVP